MALFNNIMTNNMKTEYELAEEIYNSGDFIKAFESFKYITENNLSSDDEKSDAFNMMGVIVQIDTRVDNNDESGLEYFAKSLDFNSQNTGALLNIIGGFGLAVNNHKSIEMLDLAIRTLEENHYDFTKGDQEMIARKVKLKNSLI
jgi:hypothetical protein